MDLDWCRTAALLIDTDEARQQSDRHERQCECEGPQVQRQHEELQLTKVRPAKYRPAESGGDGYLYPFLPSGPLTRKSELAGGCRSHERLIWRHTKTNEQVPTCVPTRTRRPSAGSDRPVQRRPARAATSLDRDRVSDRAARRGR